MTRSGYIVGNDKFVKIRDSHGLVNYNGGSSKVRYREEDIKRAIEKREMMDNSVNIPVELIIRSLPINMELMEMIREEGGGERQSLFLNISKFVQID